ncbi:MAG: hypothetical protein K0R94_120, partial [Burkholderiales bacterium]|nr:hypothetical protein [Burkholderiales bacterium]
GGKSLDEIITADFIDCADKEKFDLIRNNINNEQTANLAKQGASPYHPELYRQIVLNPKRFCLEETYNVIKLVEEVYKFKNSIPESKSN